MRVGTAFVWAALLSAGGPAAAAELDLGDIQLPRGFHIEV